MYRQCWEGAAVLQFRERFLNALCPNHPEFMSVESETVLRGTQHPASIGDV